MEERHIVAIDLGTSKFAVTVARIDENEIQIVYFKETPSDGIRNSNVLNPKKVSDALKPALEDAEETLGIKINQVVVGMPKYKVKQEIAQREIRRNEEDSITEEEIHDLKNMTMDDYPLDDPDHEVMFGAVAQSFSTAEEFQISENDICGMVSGTLEGNFKVFIGKKSAIRNIDVAFNNLGISVARKYFIPDAIAKAVLTESEKENGVALVDFGAGVTSVSVYHGGIMRHYAAIPFGGKVITTDIKTECCISEKLAENIKLAYGACMPEKLQSMSEKIIHINSKSTEQAIQIPVKYLSEIISARVKEILEAIMYEIQMSGFSDQLRSGVVMTGGGANLVNCGNYLKELSGYNVRSGYPRHLYSANGCDGIYETEAAASLGMILSAKFEKRLNCTEQARKFTPGTTIELNGNNIQAQADDIAVTENDDTERKTLFPEEEIAKMEPEKPKEQKKEEPRKGGIWKKIQTGWNKVGTFTGGLYDGLENNMKNEKI